MSTEERDYRMPWRKSEKPKRTKTRKLTWNDKKEFVNYDPKRGKGIGKGGCSHRMKSRRVVSRNKFNSKW